MTEEEVYRRAVKRIRDARNLESKELDLMGMLGVPGLTALPESLSELTRLQSLNLADNQLADLPEWLGQLVQLEKLNLAGNRLTALPESLGQLPQFQLLDLSGNRLTALPESLRRLTRLRFLVVYGNRLANLPEWLCQLTQLQLLNLADNRLTALPEWLGHLSQLKSIDLYGNQLSALPASLGQLVQMQTLGFSNNRLVTLPEALGKLTQLQELNLSHNQLSSLPESLSQCTTLTKLYLHANPALGLPVEVLGPSLEHVVLKKAPPAEPKSILDYYFSQRKRATGSGTQLHTEEIIKVDVRQALKSLRGPAKTKKGKTIIVKGNYIIVNKNMNKSIHIEGDVINSQVAQMQTNCINMIQHQSPGERKDLLEALEREVTPLLKRLQVELPDKAPKAAKYFKEAVEQATAAEPDREWYSVSAKGLMEAATWVKDFSGNIAGTIKNLGVSLWKDFLLPEKK